jgi:hypothetical protein
MFPSLIGFGMLKMELRINMRENQEWERDEQTEIDFKNDI